MTGLKILAGVVLCLWLLSRIRLGGGVRYGGEGLFARLRVGKLTFQVYPRKKKKPQKREEPESPQGPAEEKPKPKREKGGSLELVKQFFPLVCQAAGELRRKIRIDTLRLELVMAADNAARAATAYGYANMVLGSLWPLLDQNFEIWDPQVSTRVDFDAKSPTVRLDAAVSLRMGQLVSFALRFGWKFLRIYQKTRPHANSKKEAIRT